MIDHNRHSDSYEGPNIPSAFQHISFGHDRRTSGKDMRLKIVITTGVVMILALVGMLLA